MSVSTLSKIPYFLSFAISSVLLPVISREAKAGNDIRSREIVSLSLRYLLMLLLAMIIVVSSCPYNMISFVFGEDYTAAGPILVILFISTSFITLFFIVNTVLIARDKIKWCLIITGPLILIHVLSSAILVPRFAGMGAAVSTLIVSLAGIAVSSILLSKCIKGAIPTYSINAIYNSSLFCVFYNLFVSGL